MAKPVHAQPFTAMECSVYRHPLFRVVSGGNNPSEDRIDIRCKHCKGIHSITRRKLEKMWGELRSPVEEAQEEAPVHQDV